MTDFLSTGLTSRTDPCTPRSALPAQPKLSGWPCRQAQLIVEMDQPEALG